MVPRIMHRIKHSKESLPSDYPFCFNIKRLQNYLHLFYMAHFLFCIWVTLHGFLRLKIIKSALITGNNIRIDIITVYIKCLIKYNFLINICCQSYCNRNILSEIYKCEFPDVFTGGKLG